jgi:HJR/Mrr/RecB family endonuclease
MIAGTAGASLALIALFYSITRLRASQEETTNKGKELSRYFAFEEQVRKTLERFGGVQEASGGDRGFDFIVERGGRKIAVEVKAWSRPIPAAILSAIVKRLKEAAARTGAADAINVTSGYTPHANAIADAEGVKLLTLRELRNYVAHLAA